MVYRWKNRKRRRKPCAVAFIGILLSAMILTACKEPEFDGSRTGNDSRLIMDYTLFNMTDSQDLVMKAGETIHAELVVKSGTLSVQIQTENGEVVYEDSDIKTSGSFNVAVKENGIYTVTVTGKMAEGSVSFQKAVG